MKLPFQSRYLMDNSRCIERLEIALCSHFSKTIKRQLSALSEPSLNIRRLPVYKQCGLRIQNTNFKGGRMIASGI
jgi:hypothetical protein